MTSLNVQLLFHGPSQYNNWMLEKLRMETHIHLNLPTSDCYILRVHVVDQCYEHRYVEIYQILTISSSYLLNTL